MDQGEENKLALLFMSIARELEKRDTEVLMHFAVDKLSLSRIEKCADSSLDLLMSMIDHFKNHDEVLKWIQAVAYHINNAKVNRLVLEYSSADVLDTFTVMLHSVCVRMKENDLSYIKAAYKGLIPDALLCDIKSPHQLVRTLKNRRQLDKDNLDEFKRRLQQTDNKQLYYVVEEYQKNESRKTGEMQSGRSVKQRIGFRPPTVQEIEQQTRATGLCQSLDRLRPKVPAQQPCYQHHKGNSSAKYIMQPNYHKQHQKSVISVKNTLSPPCTYPVDSKPFVCKSETTELKQSCRNGENIHTEWNDQLLKREFEQNEMDIAAIKLTAHVKPLNHSPETKTRLEYPKDLTDYAETKLKTYPSLELEMCMDPARNYGLDLTLGDTRPKQRITSACASEDSTEVRQLITDDFIGDESIYAEEQKARNKMLYDVEQFAREELNDTRRGSDKVCDDQPVPIDQKQKTHEDSDGTQAEVRNEIMEQYSSISAASTRHTLDDLKQHSIHQTQIICEDNGPWTGVASHRSGMNCTTTEQHLQRLHVDGLDCSLEPETFVSDQDTEGHQTKKDHHDHQQQQQQCLVENEVKSVKSHKSVKLYNYQKELAEPALKGINCIMCAPTGSGKTRTAAYICYELRERACDEGKPFKALFIVCIRNLIEQQKEELMKMFGQEENDSMIVTGINDTAKLSEMLQHFDIIVLTAQILVNCLKSKEVHLDMFQLLILDECHHTNLGHPYNVIMQEYHQMKREKRRVPQIVGLTASLGVGDKEDPVDHYVLMCANLDCTCITHVRNEKNMAELLKHNPRPEVNQIISVEPRDPQEMFILIVADLMCEIESLMTHRTGERSRRGSQKYENWIVDMRTAAESKGLEDDIYICETLQMFNRALMYYDELPAAEVMPLLESHFSEEKRVMKPTKIKETIYELYDGNLDDLRDAVSTERLEDNEKLHRLCNLLADLYLTNDKSKGILLARTRFCVEGLVSFIKKQDKLRNVVKCDKFVGQRPGDSTMTDKQQQAVLEFFKNDSSDKFHINLLVATDVAQEGLDMPLCNFVIRYNFVSNEIGSVQSRGRARAKNSECYLIVNKGSINEIREYQNLEKEHAMLEALDEIDLLDEADLQQRIELEKEKLYKKKEAAEKRRSLLANSFPVEDITIHCKGCKEQLCRGTDLRKRGCNFIIYCKEFEEKVYTKEKNKPLDFRYDSHIAYTYCKTPSCNRQLGPKIKYLEGRQYGYALSRDAVMWKIPAWTEYRHIKQWSKVPFMIREEDA